jgi:hypothetical protein
VRPVVVTSRKQPRNTVQEMCISTMTLACSDEPRPTRAHMETESTNQTLFYTQLSLRSICCDVLGVSYKKRQHRTFEKQVFQEMGSPASVNW